VGVVALRKVGDKIVRLGRFGRRDHFIFGRLGPAITDVILHTAGKEDGFLGHNAYVRQERILLNMAYVHPVDGDLALRGS